MTRTIAVVTGSRADYGLLFWLLRGIADDADLTLRLIVTGAHLEPRFGHTVDVIEADGFTVHVRVPMHLEDDTPAGVARSMAAALPGLTDAFTDLAPDVAVVLGDRYEMLCAAAAAMLTRTPIAHIHGGETTEGAMDEGMRHAITKLSHLHFAAAEHYAMRIRQMGEARGRVFTVGTPGLDHLTRTPLLDRAALSAALGFSLERPLLLVTYHPATLAEGDPAAPVQALLAALDARPGARVVFTGVNADPGHDRIAAAVHAYVAARPERTLLVESLGSQRYLSLLRAADAVVGNSSSGIIEAPALYTPTVDIGPRQRGRLKARSVISCGETTEEIGTALARALDPAFRIGLAGMVPPYGAGGASQKILDVLKTVPLEGILLKRFFDLPHPH